MDSDGAQRRLLRVLITNADERGRLRINVREVAKQLGTDTHNTVHLLWRLQKQGLLTFREATGGDLTNLRLRSVQDLASPAEVALGFQELGRRNEEETPMITTNGAEPTFKRKDLMEWLDAQEEDGQGWVMVGPQELGAAWGLQSGKPNPQAYGELRNRLNMMVRDAERAGDVEVLREGRRFIGLRLTSHIPAAPASGTDGAKIEPVNERNEPATPILDAYARAKEMASDGAASRWLSFATDELAEEALRWREWAREQREKVGG